MGHHLIARLQHRFVQQSNMHWSHSGGTRGRLFWLPIRTDGCRFGPYFRLRARLDLPGPRAPLPLGTRAEGSSETDDGTDGPPTNRRSNNHSRRVGCRRTHSGHGDAVRLLPGGDPSGLLRLLVPSQAAAVRVVPGLPPSSAGGSPGTTRTAAAWLGTSRRRSPLGSPPWPLAVPAQLPQDRPAHPQAVSHSGPRSGAAPAGWGVGG